jgi:benzil reductase ((S)-benzoin forming)
MHAAIVTGVSRGLGEALAIELLGRGFRVLGVGRTNSLRLAHDAYRFVACDLGEPAALPTTLASAFAALAAERPASACLVNNAATIESVGVLGRLDAARIEQSIAVNLTAPVVLADLFLRTFADDCVERRIVNVSSGAAQSPLSGEALYCVAKAGLEMLTRMLAAEAPAGRLRAITLRPGVIDTPMQAFARSQAKDVLPSVDLFVGFHENGQLVAPAVVARKVVERLVLAEVEQARTYSYAEL